MADFIPTSDADLLQFAANFSATLSPLAVSLGLTADDNLTIADARDIFSSALAAHNDKQTAARAATQTKDAARADLVAILRSYAKRLQASPTTTDAHRADLGITIAKSNQTSVGAPTSAPVLAIATGNRLQHVVSFQDEMTPTSRAKPAGVLGCEIYRAIGIVPPASPEDYSFLTMDTATPHVVAFNEADAGKKAFYIARWANRAGQTGAWSSVASATIVS